MWQLLESFFGVDEEPQEEELQDAASLTAAVHACKAKQEQEVAAKSLTITKSSVQAEEGVEEEVIEDTASTTSSQFTAPPVRTLSQIKESKKAMDKYPSKCELCEAQLFFPTSSEMMHQTGVDAH